MRDVYVNKNKEVLYCSVIFYVEFEEIHPTQVKTDFLNKSNFQADVSHLEDNKQLRLFELLHKHTSL